MQRRELLTHTLVATCATALPGASAFAADDYPNRTVTLVVPTPAGGAVDIIGRAMAEEMGRRLGQAVIVDNKPGAALVMGTGHVAKAVPDGYTIGLTLTQAVINNLFLMARLPYDPRRDLAYVSEVCTGQVVMLVHASVPAHTPAELLAWAAAHPAKASYGSWGAGSFGHLAGSHLSRARGVPMTHVPYKNVFKVFSRPRWGAIGMSSQPGRAAWAGAHASDRAKKSPDFAPTRRASVFAGGLRRCGACQ